MKEIILASESKRRSKILSSCGILHQVMPSGAAEDMDKAKGVSGLVRSNALAKAENVAAENEGYIVIGADTLVVHGADIVGKPDSEETALGMLRAFSGSGIEVYTGLCVVDAASGKKAVGVEKSGLIVASLTEEEIDKYFRLLAPYDKAGAFSIEGAGSIIFDNIDGSYFNILGLPMGKLKELFGEAGLDILDYIQM